jgi:hypothetical protein
MARVGCCLWQAAGQGLNDAMCVRAQWWLEGSMEAD